MPNLTLLTNLGNAVAVSTAFCLYLMVSKHVALRGAQRYEGTVTAHERRDGTSSGSRSSRRRTTTYALQVAYRDAQDAPHSFTTSSASNPPARAIGEKITVFQHPGGLGADVLIFQHLFLGYWIWLCVGVCVTGCLVAPQFLQWLYGDGGSVFQPR